MKKNRNYPYYNLEYLPNIRELIDRNNRECPDDIALSFNDWYKIIKKTYKDLKIEVDLLSNYFNHTYNNKHICIIGENSYNWIILFLGVVLSGNICVIIDKDYNEEKIDSLLKKTDTKIIYYSESYNKFIGNMKYDTHKIEDIEEYLNTGKKYKNNYKVSDSDACTIFFTSGTTGPDKPVLLSQRNIASNIYQASSIFEPVGKKVVSFLPYHHALGLVTGVLKPLYYKRNTFINSSLKYLVKDLKEQKPSTIFVVPAFLEMFYKQIMKTVKKSGKDKDLEKGIKISNFLLRFGIDIRKKLFKDILESFGGELSYIICGGAYLDTKYIKFFRSIGIEVLNGYGITECSPVISVNRNFYKRDGSVGQLCKDVEVKIIDDEICVKGENVMIGYYNDKENTDSVLIDGYYHTGDLGYLDKDGFLFITGRKKNIIILANGENVSPEVIEEDLLKDDQVEEVIVYEKDDNLVACIYPSEEYIGNQEYFDNLIHKYNLDKPKNRQIAYVELRDKEFIKNNNRKILRNKFLEGE